MKILKIRKMNEFLSCGLAYKIKVMFNNGRKRTYRIYCDYIVCDGTKINEEHIINELKMAINERNERGYPKFKHMEGKII